MRAGGVPLELTENLVADAMANAREFVENAPKFEPNKEVLEWLELAELMSFDEGMGLYYFGG